MIKSQNINLMNDSLDFTMNLDEDVQLKHLTVVWSDGLSDDWCMVW